MPQTRPRGLTGSVTTGRTADPRTHALSSLSLTHTPRARARLCGWWGRFCRREAWKVRAWDGSGMG